MPLPKIRYSQLKHYHIIDNHELEIGNLEDIGINIETLQPSSLILGAGFYEELMEEVGKKENIDEIAPIDIVERVDGDFIVLSKKLNELKTTNAKGELPHNQIKFSILSGYDVYDQNGKTKSQLSDIELNKEKSRYIFNYPELDITLKHKGYGQRFDVSFSIRDLEIANGKIILPSRLDDLVQKVENNIAPKNRGKSLLIW